MSRTIVVGVDGSGCSDRAVARAIELASGLGDTLVVAYAVEPPHRSVGDEKKEVRGALEEIGRPMVDAAVARARPRPASPPSPCSSRSDPPRR